MNRRRLLIPAAALTVVAVLPGVASANAFTADATCDGMTLSMPRTEEGTIVTTRLDGRVVRTDTVVTNLTTVAFTLPSPDRTTAHTWTVTIDATWSPDQFWSETVTACTTSSSTTSTTPPVSTVVPTTTASTYPPTSVSVVEPPHPAPTSTAMPSVPGEGRLPDTGGSPSLLAVGLALVAAGFGALGVRRKGVR